MYNEENLWEKVCGHIKDNERSLLRALIADVNEFNATFGNGLFELYIDFDNVGGSCECDSYETFSIHIRKTNGEEMSAGDTVHDCLSIRQLDDCLCAIHFYQKILTQLKGEEEVVRKV